MTVLVLVLVLVLPFQIISYHCFLAECVKIFLGQQLGHGKQKK
jgi:hypothetical protein